MIQVVILKLDPRTDLAGTENMTVDALLGNKNETEFKGVVNNGNGPVTHAALYPGLTRLITKLLLISQNTESIP